MIDKIKEKLDTLPAEKKRVAVISAIVGFIIIFSVITYYITRSGETPQSQKNINNRKEIALESRLLEKTYIAESEKQMEQMRKEMEELKKQIEEEKKKEEEKNRERENKGKERLNDYSQLMPPIPPPPPPSSQLPSHLQTQEVKHVPVVEVLGDIEIVSQQVKTEKTNGTEDKKKELEKVYLPPSFMEATLLSGLDAPAIGEGKNNPVPVILRVKDIAVLPNKVKANLRGCFVIADGTGSLADERAHLRLVSLSCLTKAGEAIIDQKVKGFVVDNDGKIGLRGNVVSKMGASIARSFVSGFFGGIGSTLSASQMTTMVSPLGTTQIPKNNLENIAISGLGQGLSASASEIQRFYLELAKQAIPVIEVGASRNVTLVISEGTYLEIKDYKGIGGK